MGNKPDKSTISIAAPNLPMLFYNEARIESGSDDQKINDKISNVGSETNLEVKRTSDQNETSSIINSIINRIINLKEIGPDSKANPSTPSIAVIREVDPKEILAFLQAYGTLSDLGVYLMHKTEGFIYMTTPPDGGYGWIILFAAFLNGIITEGNIMSIGAILPSIESDLLVKKQTTAFIASIQTTTYYCVGPVSSAFINKLGFRTVAFIGLTASMLGLIIGSFCTDPISLTIFFGFFFGSGVGMLAMVGQLIVAYYFERYRAIAVGLQSASVGIGLLLYGSLNSYLTKNYGWSKNLLFMAVSFFLCYFCSAVFKKIKPTKVDKIIEFPRGDDESVYSIEMKMTRFSTYLDEDSKDENGIETLLPSLNKTQSQKHLAGPSTQTSRAVFNGKEPIKTLSNENIDNGKKIVLEIDPLERIDIFSNRPYYDEIEIKIGKNAQVVPGKEKEAKELNYRITMSRSIMISDNLKQKKIQREKWCTINEKINGALMMLFDLKLLKSIKFEMIQLASCSLIMAHFIPFLYAVERTRIPTVYSNWLLSFIGIINIILRILLGLIAYYTKEKTAYLCGGCIIFGGIGILISCFILHDTVWLEFLYCAIFTFASASFFSLRSIVVINTIGIEKLTNAFGLIYLGAGIFSFIGINIAGSLVTIFQNTEAAFIMCTIFLLISGLLFILTPIITMQLRKQENEELEKAIKKVRFSKTSEKNVYV